MCAAGGMCLHDAIVTHVINLIRVRGEALIFSVLLNVAQAIRVGAGVAMESKR